MPGKIKVKILAGRNLPVMDRSGDTTDAFVEIKFGNTTYKTEVCRKSLNPQWNSDWYKFEVEDADLQDEPLQIRLMDYDIYSANDAIGKVYINLNPLLLPGVPPPVKNIWTLEASMNSSTGTQGGSVMTGWLPVYDTMHGIRGEVNIIVKVELFVDFNKFRQSSCGVTFFYSSTVPYGYHAQVIHGFVEELVVSDDPEYKWIDKIRTPRASNEARQTLFLKLSNEVQRKIGLKALDLGGNAVIGYLQNFDLEGDSGVIARGTGTVITLVKLHDLPNFPSETVNIEEFATHSLNQNKSQTSDCSESEDSPHQLTQQHHLRNHQHYHTRSDDPVCSPTLLSNKFPLYGENIPLQPITPLKIVESKSPSLTRQMSIQSWTSIGSKIAGSSTSITDDINDETSMRAMLALEDMRGEPQSNRLTRGLRNLRNLPQNVRRSFVSRSKTLDSMDDESENESSYSSSWSIGGSDSTRTSSILELQQSLRKKKLKHKRSTGEGMAAMLIRSMHASGLPLDIVKEDRETPTPSPVNFIDDDSREYIESLIPLDIVDDSEKENVIKNSDVHASEEDKKTMLLVTYSKLKASSEEDPIPMVSSSESDTSSEDDPSESSTNYNILDDTLSLLDHSSPEVENCSMFGDSRNIFPPTQLPNYASQSKKKPKEENFEEKTESAMNLEENKKDLTIVEINENNEKTTDYTIDTNNTIEETSINKNVVEIEDVNYSTSNLQSEKNKTIQIIKNQLDEIKIDFLIPNKELKTDQIETEQIPQLSKKAKQPLIDEILSSEFSSDIDSDLPLSAIPNDYRIKRIKKLPSPVRTLKCDSDKSRLKHLPEPLILTIPSQSLDEKENFIPHSETTFVKNQTSPDKSKNNSVKVLRHRIHKQVPSIQADEQDQSDSSEDEYYAKKNQRAITSRVQEKKSDQKLLINLEDESYTREKSPRKVERTDTVIYKGPKDNKEKNLLDLNITDVKPCSPPLSPIIINPTASPIIPQSPIADVNHLKVPGVNLKDIVPKSPFPPAELNGPKTHFDFPDDVRLAQMLLKKYRQTCMMDLIKLIDSKMLHHHSHSESTKRRKHLHQTIIKRNQTPSPDSTKKRMTHHRRSRSRSPELSPSIHHHHHSVHHPLPSSPLATHNPNKHSSKSDHYVSNENISSVKSTHSIVIPASSEISPKSTPSTPKEAKNQAQFNVSPTSLPSVKSETLEMHALKTHENIPKSVAKLTSDDTSEIIDSNNIIAARVSTNLSETKTTNMDNTTDNLCVSHSPSTNRQQNQIQNKSQNNQDSNHQSQVQPPAPPVSPTNHHQKVPVAAHSPVVKNIPGVPLHRRSSDSDLSITPKGNSLTGSDRSMGGYLKPSSAIVRTMNQEALEMLEYPFLTMQQYPPGFVLHFGGLVSARSVKLLDRISNLEEPEGRDSWWTEIRMEVRSHARSLACNVVIGYKEETAICDDVCVLTGSGTAAVINLHSTGQDQDNILITQMQGPMTASTDSDKGGSIPSAEKPTSISKISENSSGGSQQQPVVTPTTNNAPPINNHKPKQRNPSESNDQELPYQQSGCSICHLPYSKSSIGFRINVSKCAVCHRAKVPDVLFTTVDLPENINITGRGGFIHATVCRAKRDRQGEGDAKEISDCLPFLEYELHSQLVNKLRVRGMNAIFGLKIQVSISERFVIGMAVGTAVYLSALPAPMPPKIATSKSWHDEEELSKMQKKLDDCLKKNVEFYQLKTLPELENGRSMSDTDESEDELPDVDLAVGMKDVCVLEVDDIDDLDRVNLLLDDTPPNDFHVVNTEAIPGLEDLEIVRNLQMFTQISRAKIPSDHANVMPSKYLSKLLQTVYFKLRCMVPCALCDLQFRISMPEQDEIQISLVGMALGLGEPTRYNKFRKKLMSHSSSKDPVKKNDDDMIFCLDEDHSENLNTADASQKDLISNNINSQTTLNAVPHRPRPRSPMRIKHTSHRHKHVPLKERYGVDISPLSYLPGGKIERYLGNLNFFFIRESNSIREVGGFSGFIHSFVTEVLAMVRAHVTALGGNAMVAFFMTQCVLLNSPHKNQGQCLINVGGDVVSVSYFADDKQQQANPSVAAANC